MKKLLTICLMLLGAVAQAQNFAITATTEAAIRKNIVKGNAANYGFGMINDTLKLVGLTTRNVIFTGSTSKTDIGLGNVDNTSDLNKPVSTATQTALNLKQNQLNGTGFVKASGTTISYDNSTYLSTSSAASTYLPISNPTATGTLTAPTIANSLGANFATSSGNVGIGTASPAYKLDVSGTARFTGAATFTGGIISNGGGGIASNTAIGQSSLPVNTTGTLNTAFGTNSLFSNTIGSQNIALGYSSLALNTTGNGNVSNGMESLFNNTTGNYNTALGYFAGKNISGGSVANTITTNSIYLGGFTKALADNQTNQIVIGHNAVGNGSNTTVLGNTSTTQTQIFGNTILSNTSQATDTGEKLQVNGTSKFTEQIVTGNLKSNADGGNIIGTSGGAYSAINVVNANVENIKERYTGSNISFTSSNGSTNYLKILSNGNVGIGTTSPQNLLQINSLSSPTISQFRLSANGTGSLSGFTFSADNVSTGYDVDFNGSWIARSSSASLIYKEGGKLNFKGDAGLTNGVAYNPTTRMSLDLSTGNVGIGTTTPNASSILDITSTTKGVLFPRMTTNEINAITSPADGLTVYNTTLKAICFYDSSAAVWKKVSHSNM